MSAAALVVFVKNPRPGTVKTRLAASVGEEAAAGLYRALAEHVLEATTPTGDYERLVFFEPQEAAEDVRAWLPGLRLLAQSGPDLGARMADAFARAFARGATRVALVGSDLPAVSREMVTEAFAALDDADVVIGPTEDGGYHLIALRAPRPALFTGMAWSTPTVADETRARAREAGLTVREVACRRDIDTLEDLRAEWPAVRGLLAGRPSLREALARVVEIPLPGAGDAGRRGGGGCRWPR